MEAQDFLKWVAQYPYGPSMELGGLGNVLLNQFSDIGAKYSSEIQFVASHLGRKNVTELERLATALYVTEEGVRGEARATRVHQLKPHLLPPDIKSALIEVDRMITLSKSAVKSNPAIA